MNPAPTNVGSLCIGKEGFGNQSIGDRLISNLADECSWPVFRGAACNVSDEREDLFTWTFLRANYWITACSIAFSTPCRARTPTLRVVLCYAVLCYAKNIHTMRLTLLRGIHNLSMMTINRMVLSAIKRSFCPPIPHNHPIATPPIQCSTRPAHRQTSPTCPSPFSHPYHPPDAACRFLSSRSPYRCPRQKRPS